MNLIKKSDVFEALDKIQFTNNDTFKDYREAGLIDIGSAVETGWRSTAFEKDKCQISIYLKFDGFGDPDYYEDGYTNFDYWVEKGKSDIRFIKRKDYDNPYITEKIAKIYDANKTLLDEMETKIKEVLDSFFC